MRSNTHGASRVSNDVKRSLSRIISELKDPRIGLMTSVTRCEVTKDLKECKVYISVLGNAEETMQGLESAKGFIRKSLASSLNLRNTPELHFVRDSSIAYGVDMSRKIDEVIAKDQEQHVETDEGLPDEE